MPAADGAARLNAYRARAVKGAPSDAEVLADPTRADARWLQARLDAAADAPGGGARTRAPRGLRVEAVEVEPFDTVTARAARLRVRYRERPPAGARWAERLFLKCCDATGGVDPRSEPDYYGADYARLEGAPLVPCLDARTVPGPDGGAPAGYLVLLADLSATHRDRKLVAPTGPHARALGAALARLHAHRWRRDRDRTGRAVLEGTLERFVGHVRAGLAPVLAELDGALGEPRTRALRACLDAPVGTLRRRLADPIGIVLVHGDPNPTNVLTPIAEDAAPAPLPAGADASAGDDGLRLIDRQPFAWSPRVWPAAADLVGASVPWWTPEERRALEPELLAGYHRTLAGRGVRDYPWRRLVEDYRTCLPHAVWTGVEWGTDAAALRDMRFLWSAQVERGLAAVEDWREAVPAPVAALGTGERA